MRFVFDLDVSAGRRQHPNRDLQPTTARPYDHDRTITGLRSADDPQGTAMQWVKGIENLNVSSRPHSGYCGCRCHHPHVHCVVTGGGLSLDGSCWISCRPGFFLSVRVLSRLFRRLFLDALWSAFHSGKLRFFGNLKAIEADFPKLLRRLKRREWVVYAKPPFGGPQQVIDHLGRYTHRVAISNNRLECMTGDEVTFRYKQYRSHGKHRQRRMGLKVDEFIRRFLMHTLPPGFQRIRHYGLLASRQKAATLARCRQLLDPLRQLLPEPTALAACTDVILTSIANCPVCEIGEMTRVEILPRRTGAPPDRRTPPRRA